MERKTQEVNRIARLGDEMKMTKADLDWDEQTMEAGAEPEELVLMKVVFHLRNQRPAGAKVKQVRVTNQAQGHQTRYLIALKL